MYVIYAADGSIQFWSPEPFDGATRADYEVVVVEGRAYRAGNEPTIYTTPLQPDPITGAAVTVADIDYLVTKAAGGDRMAELMLRILGE